MQRDGRGPACAQRLTASENPAAEALRAAEGAALHVLNALRHQRIQQMERSVAPRTGIPSCSTPYGIRESSSRAPRREGPACNRPCSTPYGIRESSSWFVKPQSKCDGLVLNALRHQRIQQQDYVEDLRCGIRVLNALRHQRIQQPVVALLLGRPGECSTPYGIRESSRSPVAAREVIGHERVLNALRHQRIQQNRGDWPEGGKVYWCSTPYGIRESSSSTRRPGGLDSSSAQRLTASENPAAPFHVWPPPQLLVLNALRHQRIQQFSRCSGDCPRCAVLNALRHQRIQQAGSWSAPTPSSTRAQRLTASENPAGPPPGPGCRPGSTCSTPYGIRESSRSPCSPLLVDRFRCSTPYGIRESSSRQSTRQPPPNPMCSTPYGIRESSSRLGW